MLYVKRKVCCAWNSLLNFFGCFVLDLKPINSTRFRYFANIVGFQIADNDTDDLWDTLLTDYKNLFALHLQFIQLIAKDIERLLILPSFTIDQSVTILTIINDIINITGQIDVEDHLLKPITNK